MKSTDLTPTSQPIQLTLPGNPQLISQAHSTPGKSPLAASNQTPKSNLLTKNFKRIKQVTAATAAVAALYADYKASKAKSVKAYVKGFLKLQGRTKAGKAFGFALRSALVIGGLYYGFPYGKRAVLNVKWK